MLRLNEAVKVSFDKHGIEIPYNHLNVHIMQDSTQVPVPTQS